ncbi:MAG: hypothetical protein U1D99_01125, partial [Candidatus Omnitrophota bacterium]|nr:hypothetical protein [Candidatus Omnitrophota bacterium]
KIPLSEYAYRQNRFKMLSKSKPDEAKRLMELAQKDVHDRWKIYEAMSASGSNGQQPVNG